MQAAEKSKPVLLLLHGALGAASQFSSLTQLLEEFFEVHSYDFPGHGGKPFAEKPLDLPILTEHLLDHLSAFNLIGCHVFGYSMGGYAALWLEIEKPGIFSSILTLGTKFDWNKHSAEEEAKLLSPEYLVNKAPTLCEKLEKRHHPNDWKQLAVETGHLMHHLAGHALTAEQLESISCPVRLMTGDRDEMAGVAEMHRRFSVLAKGSLHVLPETPHLLEKVNPELLCGAIGQFIPH